ncbi:MAG: hemin-degrading factor [Gemmatimonadota bacterium]
MSTTEARSPEALRSAWADLLDREPGTRTRSAAAELGVSEAELVATRCGDGVRRIDADVGRVLPRIEALGTVMALTRNDPFVHEKTGVYRNVTVYDHVASVVDERIDLRIFPAHWRHGFAVETEGRRGRRRSLQFFDAAGVAVHKIFLTDESDVEAFEALVEELLVDDQSPRQAVSPPRPSPEPRPDAEVDVPALEADWREMRNTHDFFGLLRRHEVTRTQALGLVSDELARSADSGGLRQILEQASERRIDLMVFVRSPGTYQIHHGPVDRIVDTPPWLNVLDPDFTLHVREDGIAAAWVVRKPTETGWVTSVEFYDADDTVCALLFGCREEGEPENPAWRGLAEELEPGG